MELNITAKSGALFEGQLLSSGHVGKSMALPVQALKAEDKFGSVVFEHIPGNGFDIWHNRYAIQEPCTCMALSEEPVIELHIVYKNSIPFKLDGLGNALMPERHYNFVYLPYIRNYSILPPGDYRNFDVHYSISHLQRFVSHYPLLERFLYMVEHHKAALLKRGSPAVTPPMLEVIRDILRWDFSDGLSHIYLETKVLELLLHAVKGLDTSTRKPAALKQRDIDMMQHARTLLISEPEGSGTISSLARSLGTNEFTLKKNFKAVHGATIFDYKHGLRMENAKTLLLETDRQVLEISLETGYSDISSFSRAFKNYFGYPPNTLRKK